MTQSNSNPQSNPSSTQTLEAKIREVLNWYSVLVEDNSCPDFWKTDEAIAEIITAFEDAGYRYWDGQRIWMSKEQLEQHVAGLESKDE